MYLDDLTLTRGYPHVTHTNVRAPGRATAEAACADAPELSLPTDHELTARDAVIWDHK